MSTAGSILTQGQTEVSTADGGHPAPNYLQDGRTFLSWFCTLDHKRIAILYLFSVLFFFLVGSVAAFLIRLELMSPHGHFFSNDTYNRLFTIHGIVMVWFFLIPAIPAILGNFVLPLMVGAKDLAFPKMNLLSWYLFVFSGLFAMYAMLRGGVDTGWTFYAPYSSTYSNSFVMVVAIGVFINGFSSIFTGLNFMVTIHRHRAPGLTWMRMPLFVWAIYATSLIFVLATPVLAFALLSIAVERYFQIGIYDPRLGGDPLLFQHVFWFYSHPAVYIMLLPAMGVVSEVVACFARRKIYGYKVAAFALMAIALYGFVVWGHHMFVAGQSNFATLAFSFLSMVVAIPSAVKVFNWLATLYKASVTLSAPMLYAMSFICLFTVGGLTGIWLATVSFDVHVHDTYFVVAHFHYIMVGASVSAFLAGLHFWWPKITGKLYPEFAAQAAAVILFIGFNVTFLPLFWLGFLGQPRRYHIYPEKFQLLHVSATFGSWILGVAYLMPFVYLTYSLFRGRRASANPWRAAGLEWQTASPPPKHNFTFAPKVDFEAYDYPTVRAEV